MRFPVRFFVFAVAAAALAALPAVSGASVRSSARASLLHEINRVRVAHGLRPLAYDRTLERAAQAHTDDMARRGYFAHGNLGARMIRFHVRGPIAGENLAWGSGPYGSAEEIVREWLASPAHRANLLRPGFRRIGLGETRTTFEGEADAEVVTADFAGK